MDRLLLYCRPGFETECANDIQEQASVCGFPGTASVKPRSGYVVFTPGETNVAPLLAQKLKFPDLVFARQLITVLELLTELPPQDRLTPLLAALKKIPQPLSEVFLETADTDEAKQLLRLCRKFAIPFGQALRKMGRLQEDKPYLPRLHIFFLSSDTAYLGFSRSNNASPWFMGIPRLKLPREAPSRAALKLEEAFHVFLSPQERERRLRPGLHAVDLGAAPGGWTWQLVRRQIRVIAVDNGPMVPGLLASGLVDQRREDGFHFRPRRPVDWLLCDIVEKPALIARLVTRWIIEGYCRETIFNLKLPMKKRYPEILRCREIIESRLQAASISYTLSFKQLYHDRAEITGHLRRLDRARG